MNTFFHTAKLFTSFVLLLCSVFHDFIIFGFFGQSNSENLLDLSSGGSYNI